MLYGGFGEWDALFFRLPPKMRLRPRALRRLLLYSIISRRSESFMLRAAAILRQLTSYTPQELLKCTEEIEKQPYRNDKAKQLVEDALKAAKRSEYMATYIKGLINSGKSFEDVILEAEIPVNTLKETM